jgi:monoterpene epsilon-lactone hydrolase
MVMGRRADVHTAGAAIAAVDVLGLVGSFAAALARVPLRAPWRGPRNPLRNIAVGSTREFIRSLMGYMTSLPIDEFRSLELLLDDVSRAVLPPFVSAQGVRMSSGEVGGVPGLWFRARDGEPVGRMVYLHGGGYIGTSPSMYALFMAHLARVTRCEVFAADYRLAPEFPFPAATEDIVSVLHALLEEGMSDQRLFIAGDSGGGGLAGSVLHSCELQGVPAPAAVVLFSPEVSLVLNEPSVTENAALDVLPWNVPTNPYLHGLDPQDAAVSLLCQDLSSWPPTFVAYGRDEIFRDAIRSFVDRLTDAGNRCEAHEAEGMFHVFPFLLPWARESREVYERVGEFIARIVDADERAAAAGPAAQPATSSDRAAAG